MGDAARISPCVPSTLTSRSVRIISNNSAFRQRHPGVLEGSDGSDRTLNPQTENYTLPVTQGTGRIAYLPLPESTELM